ncbi:MAG: TATA-box-binding protein [Promethearchaeota archaeon Loki_b32]|nr:MAG: TATA-box-binding protein [Candidatus Lokiarchaeota archaeon Loki_b32]
MVLRIKLKDDKKSLSYVIQNIVVKEILNQEENFDLNEILINLNNTEYNPKRFPGLFIRFTHPRCVIIFFRNGKLILTGLKLFNQIELVIKRLIFKLNDIFKIRIDPNSIKPQIVNLVITANFYIEINLNLAAIRLDNAIYEPEVFPGLIYKTTNPIKSVFLIFSTGKVVLTGIREKKMVEPALIRLGNLLDEEDLFTTS